MTKEISTKELLSNRRGTFWSAIGLIVLCLALAVILNEVFFLLPAAFFAVAADNARRLAAETKHFG